MDISKTGFLNSQGWWIIVGILVLFSGRYFALAGLSYLLFYKLQIRRFSGNISKTASFIGMERSALHRKLKALGIADKREDE